MLLSSRIRKLEGVNVHQGPRYSVGCRGKGCGVLLRITRSLAARELYRRVGEASVKKWPEGVVGLMLRRDLQHSHVALLKVMA